MSPTVVVRVKFRPRRIVLASQTNGKPIGALRKIRVVRRKHTGQPLNILLVARVNKVDVIRCASRTVQDARNATDNNELDTSANEGR